MENVDKLELYNIFKEYINKKDNKKENISKHILTSNDLLKHGLIAHDNSREKREILGIFKDWLL